MVDLTAPGGPKAAIDEQWDVTVHAARGAPTASPRYVFDLVITQTCASDSPLVLPKYHYGGLGFRGHRAVGRQGQVPLPHQRGRRPSKMATRLEPSGATSAATSTASPAGVAVLCHPDNFRFPQPVRLHPSEPFFCYAPSQLGDWKIEPGKPYVAKYRFVVSDGQPDAKEIERQWQEYAAGAKAGVK